MTTSIFTIYIRIDFIGTVAAITDPIINSTARNVEISSSTCNMSFLISTIKFTIGTSRGAWLVTPIGAITEIIVDFTIRNSHRIAQAMEIVIRIWFVWVIIKKSDAPEKKRFVDICYFRYFQWRRRCEGETTEFLILGIFRISTTIWTSTNESLEYCQKLIALLPNEIIK